MKYRLCEKTRSAAREALLGKWGKLLTATDLHMTPEEESEPDGNLQEAYCLKRIAEDGSIRIDADELLIGACTYKEAPWNFVPVLRSDGKPAFRAGSHVTLGFPSVLKTGISGLRRHVEERIARGDITEESSLKFLQACLIVCDAMKTWHDRYLALLAERIAGSDGEQREHYRTVYRYAERVPEQPPRNFREALQSLMFQFAFQRQCGNWPGIGRIDVMLGEYLRKDLADGSITLDEAREYLAHFWIKGCEWIGESGVFEGTGDGQHYQNILLSGVDTDGNDVENEVTFLVLDVVEETGISDFPIAVRISRRSSERLLRRIAEVQRLGTGTVAVYNNDFIVSNLVEFGYDVREARDFANDGCWEIQIPGKTCFTYYPYDLVEILDRVLGVKGDVIPDYPTFEDLYGAYVSAMKSRANDIVRLDGIHWAASGAPNVLFSLWTQDCVERAHGYFDRGARYNVLSPHASGLPDVINSLFVLKKLVYEQKKIDYKTLISYLREDWKGHEDLRARIRKDYAGYGNDEEEADALGRRLLYDFSWFQREIKQLNGVLFPAGASTFGREIAAAEVRMAQASGHHAHEILAANMTPTPGTDKEGPTAILKSLGALDLTSLVGGTALDMKIQPSAVSGEEGIDVLVALYKTFVDVGGIFLHIDIVDNKTLRDAQLHPEKYPTLAVRVSGWSARFNTLGRNFQEMVILKSMQTRM